MKDPSTMVAPSRSAAGAPAEHAIQVVGQFSGAGAPIADGDLQSWILGPGRRMERDAEFFDELCWRLLGAGLPGWRISLSVGTLHPQIFGLTFRWLRDRKLTEILKIGYAIQHSPDYLESPIRPVIDHHETVRFRLDDPAVTAPYPLLRSLRAAGGTDYYACPLTFFNGRHQASTWATDRPGGFSEADIAMIDGLVPALGAAVEARAMMRLAGTLLSTYLGRTAGQRILEGEIRRAQGERLSAAIMVTDMRGFTNLSDRLSGAELIALLDDYFDAVTAPVQAHGGEVLKFMGDGLLAIFPFGEVAPADAADRALDAVGEAFHRIERLNVERRAAGRSEIRIGIGLHLGDVTFGNVGAADRLDFTVIGPAVNLAARLETLTKRLDRRLLVSREFAQVTRHRLVSLGFQPVRGLPEPAEVFGLPHEEGEASEEPFAG